jgi:hypothetical protein
LITRKILGEQYRSFSSTLLLPRSSQAQTYSPQIPILTHPQPVFLPQFERPRFTHI